MVAAAVVHLADLERLASPGQVWAGAVASAVPRMDARNASFPRSNFQRTRTIRTFKRLRALGRKVNIFKNILNLIFKKATQTAIAHQSVIIITAVGTIPNSPIPGVKCPIAMFMVVVAVVVMVIPACTIAERVASIQIKIIKFSSAG